ncbi:MAG TPA: AMP-binding protein, partial [Acidimicrobiales bacterium]|nr:AMP-binding protein [Acidimicrobiales bacterium]
GGGGEGGEGAAGEAGGGPPAPVVDRSPDDLAVLIFTAGTSGPPRAAMLSHGNLMANLEQMQRHPGQAVHPDDVSLGVLPLFHIFGLNVVLDLGLLAGATVVLVPRFDPAASMATVRDEGVTVIAGAPPMFRSWLSLPGDTTGAGEALASVRLAVSGAAALPPEVASAFEDRFGCPLYQGYGLTEASPTVTSAIIDGSTQPGSIGLPLPGVEVRLVDHDGHDTLHGDPGEVWVRGPNVFKGYWPGGDEAPRVVTEDGWLRTGDVAVVDDEGHLYLVDRAKDLIIVSGFNVYPAEVEDALRQHEGVAGAAAVGAPHPHSGETVKAFVTAAPGHRLDPAELIEFCAGRLARYKCPTQVTVVHELPHGMGGKVLRRALQD